MTVKKIIWLWRAGFLAVSFMLLCATGCGHTIWEEVEKEERESELDASQDTVEKGAEEHSPEEDKVATLCLDLYKEAEEEHTMADLDTIGRIVKRFGDQGYAAVDSRNQLNMAAAQQVMEFCQRVEAREEAQATIVEVDYQGGFIKYDFCTKDGDVTVTRRRYQYQNGNIVGEAAVSYPAEDWNYTEEGYVMFTGGWPSQELYALELSGEEEHAAFRVQPLEETCRELNRKYVLPVGYGKNNMFLVNWREEDFGELNFYDLYDIFYEKINGKPVPYVMDDNLGVGAIYQIPKDEFEGVMGTYLHIDSGTLQSKTTYQSQNSTYEYRPRGFYEIENPEQPFPEVVDYEENGDKTITLTVHVVYPQANDSKVYVHQVVVRPLEDGGVHYVSNQVLSDGEHGEERWHTPRLTEEAWEEIYGSSEKHQK